MESNVKVIPNMPLMKPEKLNEKKVKKSEKKKVEFTVKELVDMNQALSNVLQKPLPIKIAYRLSRFGKRVMDELVVFEEIRVKLVEKKGEKNDKTGMFSITDPIKRQEFQAEIEKILQEKVEIEFEVIDIDDLGDMKISASELMALAKVIYE